MKIAAWFGAVLLVVLSGFMLFTAGWERPPIDSEQSGYRGTGMAEVTNPRRERANRQAQLAQLPEATPLPPASAGPTAGDIYQNVEVLGDLPVQQFTRLMQAITTWVSPEQGCEYCHELDNLAADTVYTKVVSRRMLEMTQSINGDWDSHVGATGVTCYTCHRGNNVPQYTWFNSDPDARPVPGMVGWRADQNRAAPQVGLASLPEDPFTRFLDGSEEIRVLGDTALPPGEPEIGTKQTEWTYALMMHMSTSLGVNCTYCHNSRAFGKWEESSPQRVTAWHGIRMAQQLNSDYVAPLSSVLPAGRLGPTGEGRKINCETCHQGVNKPLYGVSMVQDYPSLSGRGSAGLSQSDEPADSKASADSANVLADTDIDIGELTEGSEAAPH